MKSFEAITVYEAAVPGKVCHAGEILTPPEGWVLVNAGDPGLTRRLKAAGDHWVMVRKRRNRLENIGLWVPRATAERLRAELAAERGTTAYQQKLASGRRSRARQQASYEQDFRQAVVDFLAFAPCWQGLAEAVAEAVTNHAVPVGSGTVARTSRIPLSRRAEAAVIAWMRHQTTVYDKMAIARKKGERRQVRRELAATSRQLLQNYRRGGDVDPNACPLARALAARPSGSPSSPTPTPTCSPGPPSPPPPPPPAAHTTRSSPLSPPAPAARPGGTRSAAGWKGLFEDE